MRRRWFVALVLALVFLAYCAPRVFAVPVLDPAGTAVSFEDRSGIPLGTILSSTDRRSVAVDIKRVSPYFTAAILAAEDRRYYAHGGVDWLAVGRAAWTSVRCLCAAGGASTISMQTARLQFDLPGGIRGKFLQMWDAERIEAGSDKTAILQAYADRIAMGGNVYGVEAAARGYFGIPASDLDLAQSALLAGIPNDPVRLNPRLHWRAARERAAYVLDRMLAAGVISAAQARAAAREEIHLRPERGDLAAAQQLLFRLAASAPQNTSRIRTTIDLPLQRYVQAQARDVVAALSSSNVTQASVIVIDNATGEVLAYLGSLDYFDDAYQGRNDGVRSLRQPGSTLKPFLYEYALERGVLRADSVLADVPTSYAIPGAKSYSPEDYNRRFSGPVSVRTALANSLNVPAVRTLSKVGVPAFLDRLRGLGFAHLRRSPEYYGLGLTLGAGEVTLWDLAHAYVTLARGGSAIPLRTALDDADASSAQIGNADDWRLVTDILADRYARAKAFGIGSVVDMPFPAAVKTGTSSGYRDTWTIGYTAEYTVAVWVGNFTGAPMRRIAGVSGAGPLWNRIMLHLYEHRDPPRFPPAPAAMLAASRKPVDPRFEQSPDFDEWRTAQDATAGALRILFPREGDVFEDALPPHDPRRSRQQIAFRISRPLGSRVALTLNGAPLAQTPDDAYYWTVRSGIWTLEARCGPAVQRVRFTVVPRHAGARRGFVIAGD